MICNECERIKEIINDTFPQYLKDNTLDFLSYLNSNSFEFERLSGYWKNQFYWAVKYSNEYVCYILLNGSGDEQQFAPLTIWTDDSGSNWYEDYQLSGELKSLVWDNVDYCVHCGSCGGGTQKIVFGRKLSNVCKTVMRFTNPNQQEFDLIKELIYARKTDIKVL